jgi:hypothetical protein
MATATRGRGSVCVGVRQWEEEKGEKRKGSRRGRQAGNERPRHTRPQLSFTVSLSSTTTSSPSGSRTGSDVETWTFRRPAWATRRRNQEQGPEVISSGTRVYEGGARHVVCILARNMILPSGRDPFPRSEHHSIRRREGGRADDDERIVVFRRGLEGEGRKSLGNRSGLAAKTHLSILGWKRSPPPKYTENSCYPPTNERTNARSPDPPVTDGGSSHIVRNGAGGPGPGRARKASRQVRCMDGGWW